MADESFILTLVGQLDEDGTRNNVESILGKINKSINGSNINKIKIFDKDDLDKQGSVYITGLENIREQIIKLLKLDENTGVSIAEIFDDKGNLAKFKVNLEGLAETFKALNFEAAKFSDGTAGFVLNNGTQQTMQQMQEAQRQAEQTANAAATIPAAFNSDKWGSAFSQFSTVEEFLSRFQRVVGDTFGNPNMSYNLDKDNNIKGFTANIVDATGAVEQLRFRLKNLGDKDNPDWNFVYQGANVKDNVFEQQAKSISLMENNLAKFKKQVNDDVTFKFIDIEKTKTQITDLENILKNLKANVGNNTEAGMSFAQNNLKSIIETANETEKVEKKRQTEIDSTNRKLDQQAVKLEKNRAILKNFLETKVDPNSASFVGNSDKLDGVIEKLREVIKIRAELSAKNKSGEVLSERDLGRLTVGLTELRNLSTEARKASGQAFDRNESADKLAKDIEVVNARLDANIAKWKNMGVFANQFEKDVGKLQDKLNGKDLSFKVDSSNKLRELEKDMNILNSRALELQRSNKVVSGSIQDVSERIDLYKEKMKTLEMRYADLTQYSESFKNSFNSVKNSLDNVKTPDELKNWEQSFKKMNEAAKQTGIALRNNIKTDELSQKIALLRQQIMAFEQSNPRAANIYAAVFERLKEELNQVANNGDFKRIQNEFRSLKITIDQAGVSGKTFGQRMQEAFKRMARYLGVTSMMMYTVRAIREIINNVKELDTQMVRLRRVTDETDTTYKNMFNNAVKSAKELNTSVSNIIESTANLSKMNFDPATAARLADLVNMFDKVAEINNVEESTNSLVSIINGFTNLEADDAERIIDVMDNLGNKFAVSARDLSEILKRSSASLSEANNSIEESVAMGTVAQTIAQDSSKVGNALKTVSLRIQSAKAKLNDAGLDDENMIESTAELRKLILAATKVDILESDQKTFRSTYEILLDISKVWQDIDDITKNSVLQKIAGKQQSNIVSAILNNGELLEQVYKTAMDSAGTAQKEQEKWADSIEAKMGHISATFESISANMLSSDTFKNALDTINRILDGIDALTKSGMGAIPVFTSLAGLMGSMGNGFFSFQNMNQSKALIDAYNNSLSLSAAEQTKFQNSLAQTNPRFATYVGNLGGAEANLKDYNSYLGKTAVSTALLTAKTVALNLAINAGIGLVIGLVTTGWNRLINLQKDLNQAFTDATNSIKNYIEPLDDYKKKIESVIESDVSETDKIRQLNDIKDTLSEKYRREIDDIKDVTEARRILNDVIQEETNGELGKYYLKNRKEFEKQTGFLENLMTQGYRDGSSKDYFSALNDSIQFTGNGKAEIKKDIQDLFDSFNLDQAMAGYSIDVGISGNDPFEYLSNLEEVLKKMDTIRGTSINGLTKSEEHLYKMLEIQYDKLDDLLNGDIFSTDNYNDSLEMMAKYYLSIVPKGTRSTEEWKNALFELNGVANNKFLKDAIENLINAIDAENKLANTSEKAVNPLAEVLSNLQKVGDTCDKVKEEIKTADEQFEKLTKTIEDNKDVDKFFSASDIIEILELYPDLNDAILETAYGYKIEEDALEALRDAKLEEKKIALQTQLDETQGLLNTTKKKLDLYAQELNGIKSVAEARAKLAQLENKLTNVVEPQHHRRGERADITAEIAKYNDFIDAAEAADKYQKEIDKLDIELKVLGTDFDKAKDATDAQTDALNTQKDSIKELNDEYKDAKDYIDDLIKLTMEYIKKTKELEKESLKTRIDEFKKLIDRQKELLKLQQQEKKFNDDLKEQNRDLLKIKQEIDALSVEGVEYSLEDLKRRAELEEQYTEQSKKRDDFLYDHEIEVREKALDDEEKSFTEKLETQIKEIEDYLDKEGRIRQDAIDLINGKSEEFYNNLLDYTLTYTDRSRASFQQLWDSAYAAILKYADGELNVDLALMNLIASMKVADEQLKNIENSINNIKHATDAAKQAMWDYNRVVGDTKAKLDEMGKVPTISVNNGDLKSVDSLMSANDKYANYILKLKGVKPYHTGGIVEGVSTEHGEVLAKLLSGEVVVTEGQARQFMEKTLPKLAGTTVNNNNASLAPVINMGDINISGNADQSIVDKLRSVQKDIVNDVFRVINNQKNIYNGGMIR